MSEVLAIESKSKADKQKTNARDFVDQLVKEAEEAAEKVKAVREKIDSNIAPNGDCFLKGKVFKYM